MCQTKAPRTQLSHGAPRAVGLSPEKPVLRRFSVSGGCLPHLLLVYQVPQFPFRHAGPIRSLTRSAASRNV